MGLCCGTIEKANLKELIEVAGRYGFSALDTKPGLYLDARAAGASDADLRALLEINGVRIEVIDTFGPILPGIDKSLPFRERDRPGLEMPEDIGFHLAEVLEAKVINLPHYLGRPTTPLSEITDVFGLFCERARKRGFNVSIEFLPGTGVPNLSTALKVVGGISNAGVMFDTWHWSRSGGTLNEVLALKPGDVAAVQISDRTEAHMTTKEPYVPRTGRSQPSYGDLPLVEIATHLLKTYPGINLAVEVLSDEQRAYSVDEAARVSAIAMRRLFARLSE
jgi:sugar phosphate isomerase/epimerase